MKIIITSMFLGLLLWGCNKGQEAQVERWYTPAQVAMGQGLFQQNCAACHGDRAQGTVTDWNQPLADGSYPPPPLNGTAHAWHHPLSALKYTIREGGVKMGGKMPGFGARLSAQEQEAIIAYVQNFWNDQIYSAWLMRGGLGTR